MDIAGFNVPLNVPSFGVGTGNIIWVLVILMFTFVGAIVIYLIFQWKIYSKKIIVFENLAGQGFQPTFKDKARVIKLGDGGEELLLLKKKKLYRTAYGRKMGKNTYWFAIGQDGYWYNVVLGDIDAKMGMLDIEPVDRDMRYMSVAIRKNIQERYRKQGFMEKYGTVVMNGIFLLIMLIGIWFLLDKLAETSGHVSQAVASANKVQEASQNIISSLNDICGGSGIKSAING